MLPVLILLANDFLADFIQYFFVNVTNCYIVNVNLTHCASQPDLQPPQSTEAPLCFSKGTTIRSRTSASTCMVEMDFRQLIPQNSCGLWSGCVYALELKHVQLHLWFNSGYWSTTAVSISPVRRASSSVFRPPWSNLSFSWMSTVPSTLKKSAQLCSSGVVGVCAVVTLPMKRLGGRRMWGMVMGWIFSLVIISVAWLYISWNFSSVLFALRVVLTQSAERAYQTLFLSVSAECN